MTKKSAIIAESVSIDDLQILSARASGMVAELRRRMLLPDASKSPPTISSEVVASICGITKGQMGYRIKNGAPSGAISARGGRREFTIKETVEWAKMERKEFLRPEGSKAVTVAVSFFKGGVTKTTTSMTLAQGLSLLGHKVLCIDMDPQGSLTTLFGFLPDSEIEESETLGPLFDGRESDVKYAIRKTYWSGIDLIPSASSLFSAEFALPSRQMAEKDFDFWDVLNKGLDSVRDDFDVIIIDTPPSLSYTTINALFAADGVIVPMTAAMLDMASSAQFWHLFYELASSISEKVGKQKEFDFIHILLAKINANDATTRAVRDWITTVYGGKVLPVEIPITAVTSSAASEFSTVFDITKYDGDSRTYKRAREAYEEFALAIEDSIRMIWAKRGGAK